MKRRLLGKTGFEASVLGIGDLADRSVPLEKCVATVHRAMDYGLNLIDTAPMYENGYSEEISAPHSRDGATGCSSLIRLITWTSRSRRRWMQVSRRSGWRRWIYLPSTRCPKCPNGNGLPQQAWTNWIGAALPARCASAAFPVIIPTY